MENTKSIGICPICGKGHITEHPFGWACDNSSKNPDGTWYNCKFVVFRQYHGALITEDDVKTLLETGETGELQMCNKDGKPFTGKLVIKDGKVQLAFPPRYLQGRCPVCGGRTLSVAPSVTGLSRKRKPRTSWQERSRYWTAFVPKPESTFLHCYPPQ